MFAPLVLGYFCLVSRMLLGVYPTQSETVLVDLQLFGWQSLGSLLIHRVVYIIYFYLVLLITHGWTPCKPSLLPYLSPSCFFH
jgi:hypothetical protein